jgi:hypothetical protein
VEGHFRRATCYVPRMAERASSDRVLYLGDGSRTGAASYLAGVLAHAGIPFDHVPSAERLPAEALDRGVGAVVLSDYPSQNLGAHRLDALCRAIRGGLGLLAIGGWASYAARDGGYGRTPLAELLPVRLADGDDRVNTWRPCIVVPGDAHPHEITDGLPLERDLPCVTGFNAFEAAPHGAVVLRARRFSASRAADAVAFEPEDAHPLLVVGTAGAGRVACFASDVAPHWVGSLVDWGAPRIAARADGFNAVEVGCCYAALFERMVRWVRGR